MYVHRMCPQDRELLSAGFRSPRCSRGAQQHHPTLLEHLQRGKQPPHQARGTRHSSQLTPRESQWLWQATVDSQQASPVLSFSLEVLPNAQAELICMFIY